MLVMLLVAYSVRNTDSKRRQMEIQQIKSRLEEEAEKKIHPGDFSLYDI